MHEIVFAIPVVPGKEDLDRQVLDEIAGARRDDYDASLGDAGIVRQAVWHQETPDGTLALVYVVAEDPDAAQRFSSSDAPLNAWFRDRMKVVHGVDISQPLPPVRKVHDSAGTAETVA
jgi:hypothetical protein